MSAGMRAAWCPPAQMRGPEKGLSMIGWICTSEAGHYHEGQELSEVDHRSGLTASKLGGDAVTELRSTGSGDTLWRAGWAPESFDPQPGRAGRADPPKNTMHTSTTINK